MERAAHAGRRERAGDKAMKVPFSNPPWWVKRYDLGFGEQWNSQST